MTTAESPESRGFTSRHVARRPQEGKNCIKREVCEIEVIREGVKSAARTAHFIKERAAKRPSGWRPQVHSGIREKLASQRGEMGD